MNDINDESQVHLPKPLVGGSNPSGRANFPVTTLRSTCDKSCIGWSVVCVATLSAPLVVVGVAEGDTAF